MVVSCISGFQLLCLLQLYVFDNQHAFCPFSKPQSPYVKNSLQSEDFSLGNTPKLWHKLSFLNSSAKLLQTRALVHSCVADSTAESIG